MLCQDIVGIIVTYLNWANPNDTCLASNITECFKVEWEKVIKPIWKRHTRFAIVTLDHELDLVRLGLEREFTLPCTIHICNDVIHRDEKDDNGFTLPALYSLRNQNQKCWYQNGQIHRQEIDPVTKLDLPAKMDRGTWTWYRNGKIHRDMRDPVTGYTLPADIVGWGCDTWYKHNMIHRDDRDKDGFLLPAYSDDYLDEYHQYGKLHRDDYDPQFPHLLLPAKVFRGCRTYYGGECGLDRPHYALECSFHQKDDDDDSGRCWLFGQRVEQAKPHKPFIGKNG